MYFLEMGIFHCYVSLPEGTFSIHFLPEKTHRQHRNHPKIFRPSSLVHFGHDPLSHLSHHRWAQRFGHSLHLFAQGPKGSSNDLWMTNLLKLYVLRIIVKTRVFQRKHLTSPTKHKTTTKKHQRTSNPRTIRLFFGHFLQQRLDEKPLTLRKFFESSVMVVVNEEIWSSCSSRKRSLWADSEVVTLDLQLNKRHHDSIFFK